MPTFPWSKKGSQAAAGSNADYYDRLPPGAGAGPPSSYPHPLHHPQQLRQYPPDPYSAEHTRGPTHQPSRSLQVNQLSDPAPAGAPPYPLHYGDAPAAAGRPPPQAHPNIDPRAAEPPRGKLFKKRFGLSSSRDNLLDSQDDPAESSRIRRTVSTSRRPEARSPQTTPTSSGAPSGRLTPITRRSTLAARDPDSGSEAGDLRDLADFLRTTGPSSNTRRPVSLIGNPSPSQAHWSEHRASPSLQPIDAEGSRFHRPTSFEQQPSNDRPLPPPGEYDSSQPPASASAHIDRGYEPYHVPTPQHPATLPPPLAATAQEQAAPHPALFREASTQQIYQQSPDVLATYPDPSKGPHGVQGGPASELTAHLSVQPSNAQLPDPEEAQNDSPRSPVLADMPSNAPASLQPPPRRGSVESNDPPTPGMQKQMAQQQPPQAVPRGSNGQEAPPGRRTPEPAMSATDMSEQDVNQLMQNYKELREKYSKVKRYYFEKEDQVKTLQNALAHQKLSQSRTSLDDGEYMARLTRLDGLISQLAFGFRKDWRVMPTWLQPYVNKDAITVGKQEMTAVGRAFISKWLVDEIFDKYFHPGLEFEVSRELKTIQRNIRVFTPALQTGEEEEALTNKIINWRLATVDGLQHVINSPEAQQRRQTIVELLTAQLVGTLLEHMNEPPPAGIEGGVHMIMELVVTIMAHLPFESRDVNIEYFSPGQPLSAEMMRVEQGIPALVTPMAEPSAEDRGSVRSHSSEMARDESMDDAQQQVQQQAQDSGKKSLFGLMGGGKKTATTKAAAGAGASQSSLQPPGSSGGPKEERVRLCVFLALQIRNKMVLQKAPVYKI